MLAAEPLLAKRLVLVTGKGGIGKSLVAAALGQRAAASGKRVLMVESAARDQIAPLFGRPDTDHVERLIAPNLECINLDPPDNFRAYVVKYLGQKRLYETVFSHRVVKTFFNTIPGLAELMLLGRLFYHAELAPAPRPDLVIFDGFASGHFMSLMTTPDAVLQSNFGGPLARETERVKAFLQDEARCGIVYVAVPEELVVSEALDFIPRLNEKSPAKLAGVIMNRMPVQGSAAPAGQGARAPDEDYIARRARDAERAIAALKKGLGDRLPVWTLPDVGFINEPLPAGFAERWLADEMPA